VAKSNGNTIVETGEIFRERERERERDERDERCIDHAKVSRRPSRMSVVSKFCLLVARLFRAMSIGGRPMLKSEEEFHERLFIIAYLAGVH